MARLSPRFRRTTRRHAVVGRPEIVLSRGQSVARDGALTGEKGSGQYLARSGHSAEASPT
jgi:hypothetical protein